ncbi:hypothetical protein I79_006518 [Cricetulus griseus]|uniref:Uncharacterized protein n=1 Tax=Cricetulus griseus TaxID=10029 RepID=G3H822_CRIGR|nr:hypothetical protein I79_006518 [Cricetulus griseus]
MGKYYKQEEEGSDSHPLNDSPCYLFRALQKAESQKELPCGHCKPCLLSYSISIQVHTSSQQALGELTGLAQGKSL